MSPPLKLLFAGTPDFAATALAALLDSPHEVAAVYTQPDRPAGRGRKLRPSPVKALAARHGLPVEQPAHFRDTGTVARLAGWQADLMIVAAYGLLLPQAVLDAPRRGCLNIHASLLPRWRGAAPIQRAILAGDTETGITIMQMDAGLDTGPMLLQRRCPIHADDTGGRLHDRLAALGAETLLEALAALDTLEAVPQDDTQATYAAKIRKEEACLDWTRSAVELARVVRAFDPWPVAFTHGESGKRLRIWAARAEDTGGPAGAPGTVLGLGADGIRVACGTGVLVLTRLQAPGSKPLAAGDFLNGHPWLAAGRRLGVA